MADTAVDCIKFLRDTAIAADTDIGERIYMSMAPQNATYPLAVMEIISRVETLTQDSGSAVDTYRVQVDVFSKEGSTSGFFQASTIASELRTAWSRQSNTDDYNNAIDSVQETNYLSDYDPDLGVARVTNDYLIRINPEAGEIMAQNYSETEQLWIGHGKKWIDGSQVYWRTWDLSQELGSVAVLTGLTPGAIDIIKYSFVYASGGSGNWNNSDQIAYNSGSDVYQVSIQSTVSAKVTVWYIKL